MTNLEPTPVEDGDGRKCFVVDAVTGAVCTRNLHVIDKTHWFEDQDFKIQWATPPTITLP